MKQCSAWVVLVQSEKQISQRLALLSINLSQSEEEITTLFEKNWIGGFLQDDEIFPKTAREFRVGFLDVFFTHPSSVFIHSIILVVVTWRSIDPQILGELFYLCSIEIQDITFTEVLALLLEPLRSTVKQIVSSLFRRKSYSFTLIF